MLAQPRQIHHEGIFELAVDRFFNIGEILVAAALLELATEDLLPVRAPFDLFHALAGQERARPRRRRRTALAGILQMLIVEGERLVIVIDLGQIRVHEDLGEHPGLAADARRQPAVLVARPAALPCFLVFPFLGIANPGFGLDVVEPGVLDALAARPHVLAGDGTGVAADALVEVQHHCDLRTDFHCAISPTLPPPPTARRASRPVPSCARRRTRRDWRRPGRNS